jgi:hypothetical protein
VGLCALALVLSACEPRLKVELASSQERLPAPAFPVSDPDNPDERPRYTTVQVLEASGRVVWHLRAEPFGDQNSVARLVYGEAPAGFVAVVGAEPLEPGHTYRVAISGQAEGTLRFTVESDGRVRAL